MRRISPLQIQLFLCAVIVLLWLFNWWHNRPLFLDEANVARNLFDRGYRQLFTPLDHQQYAPPIYLALTKLCGELFGYSERALRLPALAGGVLTLYGLLAINRRLRLSYWGAGPLLLLLLNEVSLRYFGSIKPYAIDMGVATCLLAFALTSSRVGWRWAAGGVVAPWLSLPSVFVLAGIGLTGLASTRASGQDRLRWVGIGLVWLLSFAVLYFVVLRPSVGSHALNTYHADYFFPIRDTGGRVQIVNSMLLLISVAQVPFGHTLLAILSGVGLSIYGASTTRRDVALLLCCPVLITLAASGFRLYSLIPRLLLHLSPCWWLMVTLGAHKIFTATGRGAVVRWAGPVLLAAAASGVNVSALRSPNDYSDSKELALHLDPEYFPVVHPLTLPTFDYYHRIHPESRGLPPHEVGDFAPGGRGRYVLLYDVMTAETVQRARRDDLARAVDNGCQTSEERLYRATRVYLDCE